MDTIAIGNHKGGVGKTATTHALGEALAQAGRRVLLVDIDPQSSLTGSCGVTPDETAEANLYHVLGDGNKGPYSLRQVLFELSPNLDLAPADIELVRSEKGLLSRAARERILGRALALVANEYDVCLIDCPPSLSLLTINALSAADGVLIPTRPSIVDMRGLHLYLQSLEEIKEETNPRLQIIGIVPTFFNGRLLHHRDAIETMQNAGWPVLSTRIGQSVRVSEAATSGQSIFSYDPKNPRAKEYIALSKKVESWLNEKAK